MCDPISVEVDHIYNPVAALSALMETPATVTGPINVGNPDEHSIHAIAVEVLVATGSPSRLDHRPLPEDDPRRRRPDIGLAHSVLNWSPQMSFEDGLARTVAYFRLQTS